MGNKTQFSLPLIVQCSLFFLPVNIYIIGNWLGVGVQWSLFRYQQTYLGDSSIVFYKDLFYVLNGTLTGKSMIAAEISFTATCVIIVATILLLIANMKYNRNWEKYSAILTLSSGSLFLLSDAIQYGVFINGPAGLVIPIGLPAILFAGVLIYRGDLMVDTYEDEQASGTSEKVDK